MDGVDELEEDEEAEQYNTDSDCEIVPPPHKKLRKEGGKKSYKQTYQKQWEKYLRMVTASKE